MKKPRISFLIVMTSLFAVFLTVFFFVRNHRSVPIQVSTIHHSSQSAPIINVVTETFPVNINTATMDELTSLPGIGETLAQRIIEYRRVHGPFQSEDQLLNVEGIGSGKLKSILDLITTGGT